MRIKLSSVMVNDQDKALAFYTNVLGFVKKIDIPMGEHRWLTVAVYVNEGLTLDFDEWSDPFPLIHYCFRVSQAEFDAILSCIEAREIPYRSSVHRSVDYRIDTQHGGSIVYRNEPDGHQWKMLTVSYARCG